MRQDKTVARILLMFFIAKVVLAAPVLVRQRRLATDRTDDEPRGEPEQDPAGPVHPATPPPPAGPDTSSEEWSLDYLNELLAKSPENFPPNSPSGSHQGSSNGAPQSHGDSPLPGLENSRMQDLSQDPPNQYEWWLHSPPATLTSGDSSHELLPPALEDRPSQIHPPTLEDHSLQIYPETLEAYPPDDNLYWWHEVLSVTSKDVDQASTTSWASEPPEWEEEAAKVADETHLHP